jgi:hypothetical protein
MDCGAAYGVAECGLSGRTTRVVAVSTTQFAGFFGGLENKAERGADGFLLNMNEINQGVHTKVRERRAFFFAAPDEWRFGDSASRLPSVYRWPSSRFDKFILQ